MTDVAVPARSPTTRIAPLVFAHARVAMVTTTGDGVVVDVNAAAADLFGRARHALVQEPIARLVRLDSGTPLESRLGEAAGRDEPCSLGPCTIGRGGPGAGGLELIVSCARRTSGRDLLLLQFVRT